MKRVLFVLSVFGVAILSSCGAAGRCTANAQCPVGTSCDETVGVCVSSGAGGGGGGGTGSSRIDANYGKACSGVSDCAALPGTSCSSRANQCLNSCAGNAQCPAGSECARDADNLCLRTCTSHSDCSSEQYCGTSSIVASKICFTKTPGWSLGGSCARDGDCETGAFCVVTQSHPDGVCTKTCNGSSDCPRATVCVGSSGSSSSFCFEPCYNPGRQDVCRAGFTCRPLQGSTSGFCG